MTAFWMCELSPSDAFNRNQLLCREQLLRTRVRAEGRQAPARMRTLQVLVVGTQKKEADDLARQVDGWGYAVRVAHEIETALKVAADQEPDVILLDLAPPLAKGYDAARQLRLRLPQAKCFLIATAMGRPADECPEQCSQAGIDLLLVKPVDPSVLETLLMLERERLNRSELESWAPVTAESASQFIMQSAIKEDNGWCDAVAAIVSRDDQ